MPFLDGWHFKPASKRGTSAVPDMLIDAKFSGKPYCFCIEVKRDGYPQHVRDAVMILENFRKEHSDCYPIVAVPLLGSQAKAICDAHAIGYLDTAGNVKIATGSIIIEKAGTSGFHPDFLKNEAQSQSIFSPRASRITKCLLNEPRRAWAQKGIVEKTGLSKGMVSRIVQRMLNAGYLNETKDTLSVSSFDDLLAAWAEAALKTRESPKRFYVWAQNPRQLMRSIAEKLGRNTVKYAFTGEAGASLRAPFSTFEIITFYIESFDKFPVSQLSAQEADKGFNLVLFEPRDEAILAQAATRSGMKVADDLQLYVDLMKNPFRGQKQAEHLLSVIKKDRT
jgi:hypothetical protein